MRYAFFAAILATLLPVTAQAQAYATERGRAEFTSSVPLHTFTGKSDRLVGQINLADGTVDFYLDLATLKTGIGKRDKDMRETLETDAYPFAEFYGKLASPFDASSTAVQPVRVRGAFKIHGVERQIEVAGTLQKTPQGLRVEAGWELNLKDYDIKPPSLLVVKVDETQDLRIVALLAPVRQ